MTIAASATGLLAYVQKNPQFKFAYESYEPDLETIAEDPRLRCRRLVCLIVSEYWCGDSRRLVPRMARISEHLPGWTFESLPWDSVTRAKPLQVRAIPSFIVFDGEQGNRPHH